MLALAVLETGVMAEIEDLLQRRTDLSTFLVHLTRETGDGSSGLDNLKSIIETKALSARNPYGAAARFEPHLANSIASQKVVCFTETPLEHIWMMLEHISGRLIQFAPYGFAVTKTTGRRAGLNPVWYSDIARRGEDWPITSVNALIQAALARAKGDDGRIDAAILCAEQIFRITPYFEQMGPTRTGRKEFWWEREWRGIGDRRILDPSRIVALLAPEKDHAELERFLSEFDQEQNTRWLRRPILDPRWGLERMIVALAKVPDEEIGPFPEARS